MILYLKINIPQHFLHSYSFKCLFCWQHIIHVLQFSLSNWISCGFFSTSCISWYMRLSSSICVCKLFRCIVIFKIWIIKPFYFSNLVVFGICRRSNGLIKYRKLASVNENSKGISKFQSLFSQSKIRSNVKALNSRFCLGLKLCDLRILYFWGW